MILLAMIGLSFPAIGGDDEEKSAIAAVKAGNIELLKAYMETHPDVNCLFSNGKTGLFYAIVDDQVKICEFLLASGADPDFMVNGQSTMKWAIKYNRGRIVRLLIEYGADVNKQDENQNTPLIYAAELDKPEICKILVDRGADPLRANRKNKLASDYAFHYAGSFGYKYLTAMEELCKDLDSVPSMKDGPYIFHEADDRLVMAYYERDLEKNMTRIIEKTIETGNSDTIIKGFGWDTNSYHIRQKFTPNEDKVLTSGNIFVIGDIHGRYSALVNLLKNNKIIGTDLEWIFGDGQLVLLGDVFDRGGKVTEVLWFLYELQIQARDAGGNVHLLLGNHEIMALTGDHRYLNEKYNYFTQYTWTDYFQFYEKNTVLGRWLRSQNLVLRINDYLFMHAGIGPEFAAYDYPYTEINSRVRAFLTTDYTLVHGSPEAIILGEIGPQWYRGYFNTNINTSDNTSDSDSDNYNNSVSFQVVSQQFVDDYLHSKGLKRMVLGHNEQKKITTSFEGKIINADVAIDESGHSAQGLLISGDEIFRCLADGRKERLE